MKMTVQRQTKTPLSVGGEMFMGGAWSAWTMENALYVIPAGIYVVTLWMSKKFNRLMPLLNDVPGCPYPEIHWGSYPQNYEGCIGVGTMHSEDRLWNTQEKWGELFPIWEAAINTEGLQVEILDITTGV